MAKSKMNGPSVANGPLRVYLAGPLFTIHERRINRRRMNAGLAETSFNAPSIVPSAAVHGAPVNY